MKPITLSNYVRPSKRSLSVAVLKEENERFHGTGGCSQENCSEGFRPAFKDMSTGAIYLSCFADGRLAPLHLLDGLPSEVVTARDNNGRVTAVKDSVIAGFERSGNFYTRAEAAAAVTRH